MRFDHCALASLTVSQSSLVLQDRRLLFKAQKPASNIIGQMHHGANDACETKQELIDLKSVVNFKGNESVCLKRPTPISP